MGDLGEAELGEKIRIVSRIDHSDDQLVGSIWPKGSRDVQLEGQIATFVLSDLSAVEPDRREIIDGAEVEQRDRVGGAADHIERPPIPGYSGVIAEVLELSLPGARDCNATSLLRAEGIEGQGLLRIRKKLPLTIKDGLLSNHDSLPNANG
jgi:hypothetical protein